MPEPRVTVYSRANCPLCTEALETVRDVAADVPLDVDVEVVDVDDDPDLRDRYGDRVPCVAVDGRLVAEVRVDPAELRRRLAG